MVSLKLGDNLLPWYNFLQYWEIPFSAAKAETETTKAENTKARVILKNEHFKK